MVKHLPAMQETRVRSLGWEDLLEKKMTTHSSILTGKSHEQRSLADYSPWGRKESDRTECWTTTLFSAVNEEDRNTELEVLVFTWHWLKTYLWFFYFSFCIYLKNCMKYPQCTKEHVIRRNAVRVILTVREDPPSPASVSLPWACAKSRCPCFAWSRFSCI